MCTRKNKSSEYGICLSIGNWNINLELCKGLLKVNPKSMEAVYQKELKRHREKIGELVLQIEVLKKAEAILSEEKSLCCE